MECCISLKQRSFSTSYQMLKKDFKKLRRNNKQKRVAIKLTYRILTQSKLQKLTCRRLPNKQSVKLQIQPPFSRKIAMRLKLKLLMQMNIRMLISRRPRVLMQLRSKQKLRTLSNNKKARNKLPPRIKKYFKVL